MKKLLDYILERGKEKSTILTVLTLLSGAIGFSVSPEQSEAIGTAVVSVLALVGVFTKESN
jgi:hypothetical protein